MMLDERISLLKTKLLSFEEYEIVCFVEKGESLIPPSTLCRGRECQASQSRNRSNLPTDAHEIGHQVSSVGRSPA